MAMPTTYPAVEDASIMVMLMDSNDELSGVIEYLKTGNVNGDSPSY